MPALRVLHLVGSSVSDFYFDLSRLYAQECIAATVDASRYDVHIASITPDLDWRFPVDLGEAALAAAPAMSLPEAIDHLVALDIDVMVPHMFCVPGMTHYRALFDLLGIPYVGNAPDLMAITANKSRTKAIVAAAGVTVPDGELLRPGQRPTIAPPAIVKPVDADNSLGVSLVRCGRDYDVALAAAYAGSPTSPAALVEAFIEPGREVRCGIVALDDQLVCLPLEEYFLDETTPIRAHDDKLRRDPDGALGFVAKGNARSWSVDTDDPVTDAVWDAARTCHAALGCRHYSLFDFRIDPGGRPWFLEAGLYCSFAPTSVICTMARHAGMPLDELFARVLQRALRSGLSHRGR